MDKFTFTVICVNQEEYEAERKLIEFYRGLTEERKRKFDELIDMLDSLLIQTQE